MRRGAKLAGYTTAISRLTWSPDGKTLAGADRSATALLWDAATGRRRAVLAPKSSSMGFRL